MCRSVFLFISIQINFPPFTLFPLNNGETTENGCELKDSVKGILNVYGVETGVSMLMEGSGNSV